MIELIIIALLGYIFWSLYQAANAVDKSELCDRHCQLKRHIMINKIEHEARTNGHDDYTTYC